MSTCRCSCGASAAQNAGRGGGGCARDNPTPPGNRNSNITNRQRRPGTSGTGQRPQPRRPRPGCGPRFVVPRPIPSPATPLGNCRLDVSNSARSSEHAQIGARNPPPPVSRDQRRIRGALSGESLSARVAAARTRACLAEEAESAQTSD